MRAKNRDQFVEAWMEYIHKMAMLFAEAGETDDWGKFRDDMARLVGIAADRAFPEAKAEGKLPGSTPQS